MDISIIGGADGPTAIFLTSSISIQAIAVSATLCIAVVGIIFLMVKKAKGKH
jgi:Na+-transporting methylmalonyl-CoA/oxaloacetate decarboxylase beta subunit